MIGKATLVFLKIRKFKAFLFDYTGTCLLAVGCVFGIFFSGFCIRLEIEA